LFADCLTEVYFIGYSFSGIHKIDVAAVKISNRSLCAKC